MADIAYAWEDEETAGKGTHRVCSQCKAPRRLFHDLCDRCEKSGKNSVTRRRNVMVRDEAPAK